MVQSLAVNILNLQIPRHSSYLGYTLVLCTINKCICRGCPALPSQGDAKCITFLVHGPPFHHSVSELHQNYSVHCTLYASFKVHFSSCYLSISCCPMFHKDMLATDGSIHLKHTLPSNYAPHFIIFLSDHSASSNRNI